MASVLTSPPAKARLGVDGAVKDAPHFDFPDRSATVDGICGAGDDPPPRIFGGRHDDRRVCLLTDVAYVIAAHFDMTVKAGPADSAAHPSMFKRRLRQGRLFKTPYLGVPGLAATIGQIEGDATPNVDPAMAGYRDLGWMLHDVHRDGIEEPQFFRAIMQNGVIDLTTPESRLLAG